MNRPQPGCFIFYILSVICFSATTLFAEINDNLEGLAPGITEDLFHLELNAEEAYDHWPATRTRKRSKVLASAVQNLISTKAEEVLGKNVGLPPTKNSKYDSLFIITHQTRLQQFTGEQLRVDPRFENVQRVALISEWYPVYDSGYANQINEFLYSQYGEIYEPFLIADEYFLAGGYDSICFSNTIRDLIFHSKESGLSTIRLRFLWRQMYYADQTPFSGSSLPAIMKKAHYSQLNESDVIKSMQRLLKNSDFTSVPGSFEYSTVDSFPFVQISLIQQIDGSPITLEISIE